MLLAILERFKPAAALLRSAMTPQERSVSAQAGQGARTTWLPSSQQDTVHPEDTAAVAAARKEALGTVARAYLEAMTLDEREERDTRDFLVI